MLLQRLHLLLAFEVSEIRNNWEIILPKIAAMISLEVSFNAFLCRTKNYNIIVYLFHLLHLFNAIKTVFLVQVNSYEMLCSHFIGNFSFQ